jgi:hypothetical protein
MFGVHLSLRAEGNSPEGNSFKSLNFDFLLLIGVGDNEGFIVLIYFSLLIHVKISATWGDGRAHRTKVAHHNLLKNKFLTKTRRRIPKDLVLSRIVFFLSFW